LHPADNRACETHLLDRHVVCHAVRREENMKRWWRGSPVHAAVWLWLAQAVPLFAASPQLQAEVTQRTRIGTPEA
jgi:hypothetical protein